MYLVARLLNRKTKDIRWVRRILVPIYIQAIRAVTSFPKPRVVVNGPPKSGTHLLSDMVALLPQMRYSGVHFALSDFASPTYDPGMYQDGSRSAGLPLDLDRLRRVLSAVRPGTFVTCHVQYNAAFEALIRELGFRHVFLLRDPRDIIVSHVKFVSRERWHFHFRYFTEVLETERKMLEATIRGFEGDPFSGQSRAPIDRWLRAFVPWTTRSDVHTVRFEDLVGEIGGTSREVQARTLQDLAHFLSRDITVDQAMNIAAKAYGKGLTFRSGRAGAWREVIPPDLATEFSRAAHTELRELGYS